LIHGIGYIHECGIIHRDLKPENILIETYSETEFRIKITDFGLSRLGTPAELVFDACGTPAYVAPEILHKVGYRTKVDLWACGIILFSMISKSFPFQSQDRKLTFQQIKQKTPDFSNKSFKEDVSPECVEFIKKLLEKDPEKRLTVDQALKHPFFHNSNMV
jgi:serine/threonine protein kinase